MPAKIVVIDDDEVLVDFAKTVLTEAGHTVLCALDGEEGYALAEKEKPDLVLLDLMMPRKHGYDVCQMMRANRELDGTKIVVASGKGYASDRRAVVRMGADGYMQKPYSKKQLLAITSHLLGLNKGEEPEAAE